MLKTPLLIPFAFIILLTAPGVKGQSRGIPLVDSSRALAERNFTLSKALADSALHVAARQRSNEGQAEAYMAIGYALYRNGHYDQGLEQYRLAESFASRSPDKKLLALTFIKQAQVFNKKGEFQESLKLYNRALSISEKLNDSMQVAGVYSDMAVVYYGLEEYDKAIDFSKKALKFYLAKGEKKLAGEAYLNIGTIYFYTLNDTLTVKNMKLALQYAEEAGDAYGKEAAYNNLSSFYAETNQPALAKEYLAKVAALIGDNKEKQISLMFNTGRLHERSGKPDSAEKYYLKAVDLANSLGFRKRAMIIYGDISNLYRSVNDYKKAYEYMVDHYNIKDSIMSQKKLKDIAELETIYKTEKQKSEIDLLNARNQLQQQDADRQRLLLFASLAGILLLLITTFTVYKSYSRKKKDNLLLSEKNEEIKAKSDLISQKQNEILASIQYARRIQYALLTNTKLFEDNLGAENFFILFRPKDIVSGDFYWASRKENRFYVAICDCTGHGVPGAFMSLLNISFLNEAVNEKNITEPHHILNHVRSRLIENVSHEGAQDGMDAVLFCIERRDGQQGVRISYAAANNSPVLVSKGKPQLMPFDKMPVGKGVSDRSFTLYKFNLQPGDQLYFYTDGYADQFGGPNGKKFKYRQLNELIESTHSLPLAQQGKMLEDAIENWRGGLEQVDDICVMGIRVS